MRIGIDPNLLVMAPQGGAARYISHLLRGLAELDQKNDYYLYLVKDCRLDYLDKRHNFIVRSPNQRFTDRMVNRKGLWIPSIYRFALYEQMILPLQLKRDRIDLFHSTQNVLPWVKGCPSIATVHYVTPILHPENADSFGAHSMDSLHRVFTPFTLAKANIVIAVGETVKREVIEVYGCPEEKVRVIQPCLDQIFKVIEDRHDVEKVTTKYGVSDDYIMCMDSASFRAEFDSLLKAFSRLKKQTALPHKFVIVGRLSDINSKYLEEFMRHAGLTRNDVVRTGYVSDRDLVRLYNGAALFVYPVTHEGFGIIPIEAMACGAPVVAVTSTAPMIGEMMQGCGITVDAHNLDVLFENMHTILTDSGYRSKLVQKGLARAANSNWRTIAQKTMSVYNELFERRTR